MTAVELLQDLERRDVRLALRGKCLRIDAPQGVITEELRQDLEARKPELITLIRARETTPGDPADEIAAMPLDEFAHAGLIVRFYSGVLDCDVLFVSDDVQDSEIPDLGLTVYRAFEMKKLALWRPDPTDLRRVHAVKEILGQAYGATITAIESKCDHNREGDDA